MGAPGGGSCGGKRRTSGAANLFCFCAFSRCFYGLWLDDGRLNSFLAAALLHVVRDAVPVHAPACASVVSSTAFLGFDAGVSGGLDAGGVGRVGENAAACRTVVGAAAVSLSARLPRALLR